MGALDPRIHPFRRDIAASHLRGKVVAERFADGIAYRIVAPHTALRKEPRHDAPLETEALLGEQFMAYEIGDEGWAWGQLQSDGYVGFIAAADLGPLGAAATHKISARLTLGFPGADIKLAPLAMLPFGACVTVSRQHERFAVTDAGLFLPLQHVVPLSAVERDIVATAQMFLGTPYLWGGKTALGIDCSGLVQVALHAAGLACPRDSDLQGQALGKPVPLAQLRRGDLVFWKGHVALARDAATLLHANAHHMAVAIEPVTDAIARIRAAGSEVSSVRRL